MGLDTTHGCWSGPYSAFARFREGLVALAWNEKIDRYRGYGGSLSFPEGDALSTLIDHSDCDDDIAPELCGPLADRLTELLEIMPDRAMYDTLRPATERFIAGLREAAAAGEAVEFC